ncbi:MAG: serine/threonine protein kinase [Myxococcales bacterium]|nr:serine/threonine protein kinase [Myxococcales bacterium]
MPEQFGKYLLQRKLAEGGMAEVFLAKQSGMEGFEKPVVVKRILPHLTGDPKFVEMFINEARVAARLTHPSIVQTLDLGKVDDQYFITMEFIHGEDLRTIAKVADQKRHRPALPLIVRIVADMLGGLHYAHTRAGPDGKQLGLVHRDISPQNILITYEGGIKVVDFGIAKATESASDQQTQAGLLKGKYAYMSPEQCRGKKLDARSDVFAVGILLWELVTWRRLFRRDSDLATLVAVADEPIPDIASVEPQVPAELDMICMRALQRDLPDRYPNAQSMQSDLEALIRKYGWQADSIALQRYMRELFADKLSAQDEAVRAAGVGSLEDLLVNAKEGAPLAWMDPVIQTGRTPSASMIPFHSEQSAPSIPRSLYAASSSGPKPSPSQQMRILPVPQAPGPAPGAYEHTPSTLRRAVGQAIPNPNRRDHITAQTGAAPLPPPSGVKRAFIVGATSLLLAGAVLTAVLWPEGAPGPGGERGLVAGETATIRVELDADGQIFLDGVRQLPGREVDLVVSAHRPHEVKAKRGSTERKVTVPPLDAGVVQKVRLKIAE